MRPASGGDGNSRGSAADSESSGGTTEDNGGWPTTGAKKENYTASSVSDRAGIKGATEPSTRYARGVEVVLGR